ncbi:6388_t:CDS:1, partial [Gigaspora margarita]
FYEIVDRNFANDKYELKSADEIIPTLSTEFPNYSKDKFISKSLNFKNLNSCGKYVFYNISDFQ